MLTTENQLRQMDAATSSLLDAVGHTPLLPLHRLTADLSAEVHVFAKAEWMNPGGSVKDRPAANIIRTALANGQLQGRRLLDSTSGNMGISYATFAASLGIPVTLAIPASASPERIKVLRALGADLHLSDALEGSDGAITLAQRLLADDPERYFFADQYNNPANWQAHYQGTGPEIWEQTGGAITNFVVGVGTTGTLMGVGRFLRDTAPQVRITAFYPNSPFHGVEGLKHMPTAIRPGIYDETLADETLQVTSEEAHQMTRRLAQEEGIFVGVSSGAAAAMALKVAATLESGTVVTVFPDAGYKYLSDNFWGFAQ